MRWETRCLLAVALLAVMAFVLAGCGGSNTQIVYQNVSERTSYNADASRVAFASFGGNNNLYVYSISSTGTGLTLLTTAATSPPPGDLMEGGKQPAWSPSGADICIASRRAHIGVAQPSQSLYCIDTTTGDSVRINRITDDSVTGADQMPNWFADNNDLIYVSTKGGGGTWEIYTQSVTRVGSVVSPSGTPVLVTPTGLGGISKQWPAMSPDSNTVAFQVGVAGTDDTYIATCPAGGGAVTVVVPQVAGQRNECPAWSADGTKLYFHSNRNGSFNIWQVPAIGGVASALTSSVASDGFANTTWWAPLLTRIVFTRAREVWTMAADGSDPKQLTQTFQ
jgi:Tol biopolymer transport system component